MNIINMVKDYNYTQWIEKFVGDVIRRADIKCEKVIIGGIDPDKRIFLHVDGAEYDIRMWSYRPVEFDLNNMPCAEAVDYTLFKMIFDNESGYGEEIDNGCVEIRWNNCYVNSNRGDIYS